MIIHACCSDDDTDVLSFMLFSTEGLYIETGHCKFWFSVSVLRHWSYFTRMKKNCECAQGHSLVGGEGGRVPHRQQNEYFKWEL